MDVGNGIAVQRGTVGKRYVVTAVDWAYSSTQADRSVKFSDFHKYSSRSWQVGFAEWNCAGKSDLALRCITLLHLGELCAHQGSSDRNFLFAKIGSEIQIHLSSKQKSAQAPRQPSKPDDIAFQDCGLFQYANGVCSCSRSPPTRAGRRTSRCACEMHCAADDVGGGG